MNVKNPADETGFYPLIVIQKECGKIGDRVLW